MTSLEAAYAAQLANIEKRSGKSLAELGGLVHASGLTRHGEIRDMLKRDLGMGHGDANALVHHVLQSNVQTAAAAGGPSVDDVVAGLYTGPKEALRPIHDKLMAQINEFGEFEIAPKKTYISLRRKKQFAIIGPATNTRVDVGLNMKGVAGTDRLIEMPPGGMCSHTVRVTNAAEVDAELCAWTRTAYDSSG